MTTRTSIRGEYGFKTVAELGPHVTQIALDGAGDYAVNTTTNPLRLANQLRDIANHIEEEAQP